MTATSKFQSIVLSLTTAIIILTWHKYGDMIKYPDIIVFISGGFISLATYKLLYELLKIIFSNSRLFRKLILRKSYLEGTWAGFYIGISGKVRFIVEDYKQDLDGIVIKGKGFDENKNRHANWISDIAKVEVRKSKISYMYEVTPINEKMNGIGVAEFDLENLNIIGIPKKITGYSSDNHNGIRIKSIEKKISSKHNISEYDALEKAQSIYDENIGNY